MIPRISVIIPVYNAEKFLDQCIKSVLSQSISDFEILLVNDGSTDNSGSICDQYAANDARIKVFHRANGGVSAARNTGLQMANGEWVSMLDADDSFCISRLERFYEFVANHNYDMVFDNLTALTRNEIQTNAFWPGWERKSKSISMTELLRNSSGLTKRSYGILKPFIKNSFIARNKLRYNESLKQSEDFELYVRVMLLGGTVGRISEPGYLYRLPDTTNSSQIHNASKLNVDHRYIATRMIYDRNLSELTLTDRFWLLVRLRNGTSLRKIIKRKKLLTQRMYLKVIVIEILNPWFMIRRILYAFMYTYYPEIRTAN